MKIVVKIISKTRAEQVMLVNLSKRRVEKRKGSTNEQVPKYVIKDIMNLGEKLLDGVAPKGYTFITTLSDTEFKTEQVPLVLIKENQKD